MPGTTFAIEVRPRIPPALSRLPELAGNLLYSWDRDLRHLFRLLDSALYDACGANLRVFLRRVSQERLDHAAQDPGYIEAYRRVTSVYDAYRAKTMPASLRSALNPDQDLVAYFCLEFGLHESLPLYSGGLGILAGDFCKAVSDLAIPFVAVGLLYRQGYFEQRLDGAGVQVAHYHSVRFEDLPVDLVRDADGREIRATAPIGHQEMVLRIWRGQVGHAPLYLLDGDIEENPDELRSITHRLYGGDHSMRIRQEIVLGIGGVRALRALGLSPTVWHLNEGHAALQFFERCRELVTSGLPFEAAVEAVAAASVFTTHTPVAAGHDVFDFSLVDAHLGPYFAAAGFDASRLLGYGHNSHPGHLNMTALALRGSRHHNGVSAVHGRVASVGERYVWPEVPPEENPITHVTNGVHLASILALDWVNLFDVRFGDWRSNLANESFWECIDQIPNHQFLSIRQELKNALLADVRRRLTAQHRRNGVAEATIERAVASIERVGHDALVVGFARRFATYKRATLLFSDPDRLARLLGDPERPVIVLMAGKAHPHDSPGQELIRQIHDLSMSKPFLGRVHLIENYDLALGRALVAGVDVWLNTPEHPLEASGTSGMKAAMNGVINLSVLDGWWAEAYDGENGWAIRPHDARWDPGYRSREEAFDLLETLERRVIPEFFERAVSPEWITMAKRSMRTIIPRFNAERMVRDYVTRMYAPASRAGRGLLAGDAEAARALAAWKHEVARCWDGVAIARADAPADALEQGAPLTLLVHLKLNGLAAGDVRIECIVAEREDDPPQVWRTYLFETPRQIGEAVFSATVTFVPPHAGLQLYRIRMYPYHPLLSHPFEMGRMRWV
jgi:starch phosphorylase